MNKSVKTDKDCPSVAIVILNWNGKDNTLECLNSLEDIDYPNFRVIVVDNGSTDGFQDEVSQAFPQHYLICNDDNLGFPGGNNVGIKCALKQQFDYVLLLNHDTLVESDFLKKLVNVATSDQNIGICGPRIVYHSNPELFWSTGGYLAKKSGCPYHLEKPPPQVCTDKAFSEVDWVSGCALLIKASVIERIGLLDDDYFVGTEDVDWCVRTQRAGYTIAYVDNACIAHKKRIVSFNQYNYLQQYYTLRNLLIFIEKNGNFSSSFYLKFLTILLKRISVSVLTFDFKSLRSIWFAITDFCAKRYGKCQIW